MVKLFRAPAQNPPGIIDPVADFGAVGDGVTDNADALMAMRQYMADRWDQHFEVRFPHGHYAYSNNLWINNVGSVTVDGNGSKFECTYDGSRGGSRRTFFTRHIYDDAAPTATSTFSGEGRIVGCPQARFERALAGGTTVTVKPQISGQPYLPVTDLAPGDRVFLWAFDQQFSNYPPNMKYFEWNEVKTVDATARAVTFKTPLQFNYEEDLRDDVTWSDVFYGSARFFKLDRPSGYRYPRYIELRNLFLHPNRNSPVESGDIAVRIPCDHLVLDNLIADTGYLWLGFNRIAEVFRSRFDLTDIDKLGGKIRIRDCHFDGKVGPASGILNFDIENCTFSSAKLCARHNRIVGNRAFTDNELGVIKMDSVTSIKTVDVRDNVFVADNTKYLVNTDTVQTFSPDSVQSRDIILTHDLDAEIVVRNLDVGAKLRRGSEVGEVYRIWFDDALTEWHIETNFENLDTSDTFSFVYGQKLVVQNNEVIGRNTMPAREHTLIIKDNPIEFVASRDTTSFKTDVYSYLSKIQAQVIRPHRNIPTEFPNPWFRFLAKDFSGSNVFEFKLNVTEVGAITMSAMGDVVWGSDKNSIISALQPGQLIREFEILAYRNDGGDWTQGWVGEDADKPIIRVRIEGQSIL